MSALIRRSRRMVGACSAAWADRLLPEAAFPDLGPSALRGSPLCGRIWFLPQDLSNLEVRLLKAFLWLAKYAPSWDTLTQICIVHELQTLTEATTPRFCVLHLLEPPGKKEEKKHAFSGHSFPLKPTRENRPGIHFSKMDVVACLKALASQRCMTRTPGFSPPLLQLHQMEGTLALIWLRPLENKCPVIESLENQQVFFSSNPRLLLAVLLKGEGLQRGFQLGVEPAVLAWREETKAKRTACDRCDRWGMC